MYKNRVEGTFFSSRSSVAASKPPDSSAAPPSGAVRRSSRSRVRVDSSLSTAPTSLPPAYSRSSRSSADCASRRRTCSISSAVWRFPARPSTSNTAAASMAPPAAAHWSKRLSPSRSAPSARRLKSSAPSGRRSIFSCPATYKSRRSTSWGVMRLKAYRWQRERMVAGTLCSSVVARMKMRCSGGSSRIFSSALNAGTESICTSSTMYTRFFTLAGEYTASSRRART